MNNKAIVDDWRIKLALPLFLLIDLLLKTPPIAQRLFDRFRTPDNIRNILQVCSSSSVCRDCMALLAQWHHHWHGSSRCPSTPELAYVVCPLDRSECVRQPGSSG